MLITFEGIEGSGKSTQLRLLRDFLEAEGWEVVVTREPGGTELGEEIRKVLLSPANTGKISPWSEVYLYLASRVQHLEELILPAGRQGKIILCDRFEDATLTYQGKGRELGMKTVGEILGAGPIRVRPDLTLLLDLSPEEGLKRLKEGGREPDRFEQEDLDFHRRVREGYREIAREEGERVKVIEAEGTVEEVQQKVIEAVREKLGRRT